MTTFEKIRFWRGEVLIKFNYKTEALFIQADSPRDSGIQIFPICIVTILLSFRDYNAKIKYCLQLWPGIGVNIYST